MDKDGHMEIRGVKEEVVKTGQAGAAETQVAIRGPRGSQEEQRQCSAYLGSSGQLDVGSLNPYAPHMATWPSSNSQL